MLCIEQCVVNALLASLMPKSGNVVQLAGDVAFVRGCGSQAFGVTVSVPFFRSPEAPVVRRVRLEARVEVEDVSEDVKPQNASVSQPGVDDASSASVEKERHEKTKSESKTYQKM